MSKETLHRLRFLVPGLMIVVALALLILPWAQGLISFLSYFNPIASVVGSVILLFPAAFLLGAVYHIFGFRNWSMGESKRKIDSNIRERLLAPYASHEPVAGAIYSLRKDERLLNIFYRFVDNDESLKERAKDVYLNGLLWSSVIDAMVISSFSAVAAVVALLISWRPYYILLAFTAIGVYSLAKWMMLPRVVQRHIDLGNRQIDFMVQLHEPELRSQLENLAEAARKE